MKSLNLEFDERGLTMQAVQKTESRDYSFDNIRAVLITCVVFAHLLEIRSPFSFGGDLYRVIYSFHMPVFLFICGWFARFDRTKLLYGLFLPYLMLQTAYIFFQRWLYGTDIALQFTTPYWLLWFLLALFFYHLLFPLYDVDTSKKRIAVWKFVLILSFAAGYDATVGYSMTLSRLLVFQPWFLLGFYARRTELRPLSMIGKVLITSALVVCIVILCRSSISNNMLYGSYSYDKLQYHAGIRIFLAFMAMVWVLMFYFVFRPFANVRIPLITTLGKNTLPVFLLHGFIVKYIGYRYPQLLETPIGFLVVTCLILVITGNPVTTALFSRLLPGYWVKKFSMKRESSVR